MNEDTKDSAAHKGGFPPQHCAEEPQDEPKAEEKAVKGPPENKAVKGPAETK